MRPEGRRRGAGPPGDGALQPRGRRRRPGPRVVYLTEDEPDGLLLPLPPDRLAGPAARRPRGGLPGQHPRLGRRGSRYPTRPRPTADTRAQVPDALRFRGGEGCFYDRDVCWFTTKYDNRVWAYSADTSTIAPAYVAAAVTTGTPVLRGVDALTVSRLRDVYVAEDGDDMQINLIRGGTVATFLQVEGQATSEITGLAFDPQGGRLYFSSQRGTDGRGITYEVRGPF